jgi:mevalonate kinase
VSNFCLERLRLFNDHIYKALPFFLKKMSKLINRKNINSFGKLRTYNALVLKDLVINDTDEKVLDFDFRYVLSL